MKKIKLILVTLNIVLFMAIYLSQKDNDEDLIREEVRNITDINSITEINISKESENILLYKKNFTWKIKSPLEWKVNAYAISKFLNTYSHIKLIKFSDVSELLERGELLKDYGIQPNSSTLVINRFNKTTKFTLGSQCRDGKTVFCKLEIDGRESDQIWRVSKELVDISNTNLSEWANMNLIETNFYQILKLSASFKSGDGITTETVLNKTNTDWSFTHPFMEKANSNEVRVLCNRLLNEKISEMNFKQMELPINLNLQKEWKAKLVVEMPDTNISYFFSEPFIQNNKSYCYSTTSETNNIFKVQSSFINELSDWTTKLREKKIFRFKYENIEEIIFKNNQGVFSLLRTGKSWSVLDSSKQKKMKGDSQMIRRMIEKINQLEVREFISFNPSQQQIQISEFDNTSESIQIRLKDTSTITILGSKNFEDASLWKIFIPEQSVLCLIEESWTKIVNSFDYQFQNKIIFMEGTRIDSISITNKESKTQTIENNSSSNINEFSNLYLDAYLNTKSKDDGTWHKGDWVPWKYKVKFNYTEDGEKKTKSIALSEKLGASLWLGTFEDSNVTFNLPSSFFKEFHHILKDKQ